MNKKRITFAFAVLSLATFAILAKLFYWQVIAAEELAALGESQHLTTIELPASRGEIRSSDGFPLAANIKTFLVFAYLPQLEKSTSEVAKLLSPILASSILSPEATSSGEAEPLTIEEQAEAILREKLASQNVLWIPLVRNADLNQKEAIEALELEGVGTEPSFAREYPEASMAASLLGFVASDIAGNPKGYFGLEGFYDLELKGRPGLLRHELDAAGKPILIGSFAELEAKDGRHLVLSLDRAVQKLVEAKLKEGIKKYGAKSGEVVILDPKSGAVIAMAAFPGYDPVNFLAFDKHLYKNPVVAESYEPGSAFKVITMAAAIDAGAITPETECEICEGPVAIGEYSIRTWDNKYHPRSTMREVIEHSDNVGMVFAIQKLGIERLYDYLLRFGIGEKTGIDLEEESSPNLRPKDEWREIDLATAAFGQGIALTGIQMARAVAAIANSGIMLTPRVVQEVVGEGTTSKISTEGARRVISSESAEAMTEMLVNAVENGEAKWAKPAGYQIAGKTGTAQIPVAGHYDQEKTIASFVGFAPAADPKFVMLVKLREPETSPWGSETAAPLWFSIAKDLFYYYGVQPSN